MLPIVPTSRIKNIDLRQFTGPVLDQGQVGACHPVAFVQTLNLQMRQSGHEIATLSWMQSYADTRIAQGTFNTDSGSVMETTFQAAQQKGISFASTWANDPSLLYVTPSQAAYNEAATQKLGTYSQLETATQWNIILNGVKQVLSEGKPVIMGYNVDPWWMQVTGSLSSQTGTGTDTTGSGHSSMIVGVGDNNTADQLDDYYIVQNSWGTSWGDGGFGKLNAFEFNAANNDLIAMYVLNGFDGIDWTYSAARNDVAELFVGLLERSPNQAGLDWYAAQGLTQYQIADAILSGPEAQSQLPNTLTNSQFVDELFVQALGRHAAAGGLAFWTQALDSGLSRSQVAVDIINGAQAYSGSDPLGIYSRDFFNDRLEVAMHYSVAYQGNDINVAQVSLIGVTNDYETVIAANNYVADLLGM